jgi:hypothetical protein
MTESHDGEYNRRMNEFAANASKSPASQGKYAVLGMLGLAVLASAFAWYWNVNRGHKSLAFYGSEAAALIRGARTVEIFARPSANQIEPPGAEGGVTAMTRQIDISRAPGLLNARSSLLDDHSYDWEISRAADSTEDRVLIRFVNGNEQVMLRFDIGARTVEIIPEGRKATLVAKTAEGWRAFIARHTKDAPTK